MPVLAALALALAGALAAPPPGRTELVLQAGPPGDVTASHRTVDDVAVGDVLVLRVDGLEAEAAGLVEQCADATSTQCWNRFPVRVDETGRATFQYQLDDRVGSCERGRACVVRATVDEREVVVVTYFGGPAPPAPSVAVTPAGPVAPGSPLRVVVSGLRAGDPVTAAMCPPSCVDVETATAPAAGTLELDMTAPVRCDPCAVAVAAPGWRSVTAVDLTVSAGAEYDRRRLVTGLVVAAALLVAATWLVRSVDWTPPSEAFVPDVELEPPDE